MPFYIYREVIFCYWQVVSLDLGAQLEWARALLYTHSVLAVHVVLFLFKNQH